LGADPNVLGDRQASVLITALVHKSPVELLELLTSHGADPSVPNVDGFGALHAIAEVNYPEPLPWLLSKKLDIEQRTHKGHTPLHIASALGHVGTLKALLDAGADPFAKSPEGATARYIALAEGKKESVSALDEWRVDGRSPSHD
jgi:cytohesin